MSMTSSMKQMPTNEPIMINEENPHHSEGHLIKIEIYKNLRRQSPSLALILTIVLPIFLLLIHIICSPRHTIPHSSEEVYGIIALDFDCLAIVLGWLFFQSIFFVLIKHALISVRSHRIIAFISSLTAVYSVNKWKILRASYIYDNIEKILFASIVIAYFIAVLLFIMGTRTRYGKQINPIVGFFYGTDINLTIGNVDLRSFLEFRAGLIGWTCLNLSFLFKTIESQPDRRSTSLILVVIEQILQAFQLIYYETNRSIQENHLKKKTTGFLHVFNALCCFPFLWCLPSQYLTLMHTPIKRLYIMASIIVFITGMFILRRVQKKDPSLKKNSKSIVFNELTANSWSGCRHPYYLGNLLMLMAWSLLSGSMLISWILPMYYLLVLYYQNHPEERNSH